MTTVAFTPPIAAAQASACAWLPADTVITPRARCSLSRRSTVFFSPLARVGTTVARAPLALWTAARVLTAPAARPWTTTAPSIEMSTGDVKALMTRMPVAAAGLVTLSVLQAVRMDRRAIGAKRAESRMAIRG